MGSSMARSNLFSMFVKLIAWQQAGNQRGQCN
jgi:hypothetical protein